MEDLIRRPRRNRKTAVIRDLVQETVLTINDFIYPVFVQEGVKQKEPMSALPGQYCYTTDLLLREIEDCMALGIKSFCIFPVIHGNKKNRLASEGYNAEGFYIQALRLIKETFSEVVIMTDLAMDPYSSEGHDGLVKDGRILNDETLEILGKMALLQAEAGADILGPSDMMDGRVGYLRRLLDQKGYQEKAIMAYSVKYASAFYGPFRQALGSSPRTGDKKTYQMNPGNIREALLEASLDEQEGADILMVKPALAYLDVIRAIREHTCLPVAAYNVSGEYALIKAAGQQGWVDVQATAMECLLAIKRAGADIILSYFARDAARWIRET